MATVDTNTTKALLDDFSKDPEAFWQEIPVAKDSNTIEEWFENMKNTSGPASQIFTHPKKEPTENLLTLQDKARNLVTKLGIT
jgi:hypothetical protein